MTPHAHEKLTDNLFATIPHGFFTRLGGVSQGIYATLNCGLGSYDHAPHIQINRDRVAQSLGAKTLITGQQTHSTKTAFIDNDYLQNPTPINADALISNCADIALGVLTADCVPVLLACRKARLIATAHAGWRGAADGIIANVVAAMRKHGANDIAALIGPAISQAAYEVDDEFADAIKTRYPQDDALFYAGRAQHWHFDLPRFVYRQLQRANVQKIATLPVCTYRDSARFFSYRRASHQGASDYGRQVSAIALARENKMGIRSK